MTALVSGSTGFIGKYLVGVLEAMGVTILPLDHTLLSSNKALSLYLNKKNIDFVFHLASYGNHYNQVDDQLIVEANINGTFNLLKATKDINYKAFVNFSSSSVLLPNQTVYSATKSATEFLCNAYAQKYNKPIMSVRPSSVYGPGEASFRFIPKVIHSLLTDEPMPLAPKPKHDWIYVGDFIIGMLRATDRVNDMKGLSINISTNTQHTNGEIVEILEKISGKKLKTKGIEVRSYDTKNWDVNNDALKTLGWTQQTSLEEGLTIVYEYEKARHSAN